MLEFQRFVDAYPPSSEVRAATDQLLAAYSDLVPEHLLQLWKTIGFGAYAGGLLQIVNPDDYQDLLRRWLSLEDDDSTRIPIAISAFGQLFYYRRLSDEGDEDVCALDPHRSDTSVLAWSLDDFFNDFLCDKDAADELLEVVLFTAAIAVHGALADGQMFAHVPALRLGGDGAVKRMSKVDTQVHQEFLLTIAL